MSIRIHMTAKERRQRARLRENQLMQNVNALRVDLELLELEHEDESDVFAVMQIERKLERADTL